ncbi:MAG: TetR/AcrR family transcriptional regulator C-terminal ligand-binding domain-containing protein [Nostoc sp. TH1S01]|nr:TetR/AcrR family transcriptional regulator C-terminal ligand-binding domain-containing protein [Nostoc sp. TH1S01]
MSGQLRGQKLRPHQILLVLNLARQFAQVYWKKYTKPRRDAFAQVMERAKSRGEIQADADIDLIIDLVSGSLYYALVFKPTPEPLASYMRQSMELIIKGVGTD